MLDIVLFRTEQGGNPEVVKESQKKRYKKEEDIDLVVQLDGIWRTARHKGDLLNRISNTISKVVGEKKKAAHKDKPDKEKNISQLPSTIDIKFLEIYLSDHSYLGGYIPCQLDIDVFLILKNSTEISSLHSSTLRWLNHLHSFNANEFQHLPKLETDSGMFCLAKEADGTIKTVPAEISENLTNLTADNLRPLTVSQLKEVKKLVEAEIVRNGEELVKNEDERDSVLKSIGNIVYADVPVSDNEDNNAVVRKFGEETRKKYSHVDLIHMIGGADLKRGSATAGGRGYYLTGPAVFLERAIINLALNMLYDKGFNPMVTPFFMRKDVMQEVAQLSQFDEELYKVLGKGDTVNGCGEEKYLIATSEQPIAAFHRDEWIAADKLPIKYAGLSHCFRQEVGSHGRDTRGIFRVHQFQKVEQFCITSPHDGESWKMLDEMISNAEEFTKALNLPYRVVNIVSGELNNAAAKKLDLETWFPGSGAYRELVSCSNCTDYQSRRLKIRYGATKKMNAAVDYVHMLNGTMCATTRVICAILENYQTEQGITVPDVLKSHMPKDYQEEIPFILPPPIEEETKKKSKKEIKAEE